MNAMEQKNKMVIYQVFPRWFGNLRPSPVMNGSLAENGVGKFSAFTPLALSKIKELGVTHVWYTGVIEHATKTDYTMFGIRKDHSAVVKGKAGSPYAIKDYYDIDPDLADNIQNRMSEFEDLVKRTHEAGMKVIIDFVPNHVARQYFSDAREPFVEDLGQTDNVSKAFDVNNNFYYLPGQTLTLRFDPQREEDFAYSEFPAKVTGNNHFDAYPSQNDWYETVKLNYGVDYMHGGACHFNTIPNTWEKMLEILLFWADKGGDGFRCDMAEMVPVEFWNWVIPQVKKVRALKDQRPQSLRIASCYSPFFMKCFLEMRAKLGSQPQDSFQEMPLMECLHQLQMRQVDLALMGFLSNAKESYQKRAAEHHCQLHSLLSNVPVQVMMRVGHPLSGQESVLSDQLREYPFVFYGDDRSLSLIQRVGLENSPNLITVSDRGSFFDILQSGDYLSVIALIGRSGPVRSDFCYIPLKNPKLVMDFVYATRNGEQLSEREKQFLRFSLSHSIANVS